MPIVRSWCVFGNCEVALWQLTETTDTLKKNLMATALEWQEYAAISHPQKQREWLAGRQAMQHVVRHKGLTYNGLQKDEFGKPHLIEASAQFSMSHSSAFVAVVLHPHHPVGIDIERVAPKLERVAPKFLSEAETQHAHGHLKRLATYWCAKEALYKLHGTKKLRFKEDIPISPFGNDDQLLTGRILQNHTAQTYQLYRFWIQDFCGIVAV